MISTAIFFFSAGAILSASTLVGWMIVHGGTRKPSPSPFVEPEPVAVYVMEQHGVEIDREWKILQEEERWRTR